METETDPEPIDAIYEALDDGQPDRALELTHAALAAQADDDPVLRYLAGRALLELGRPRAAAAELERAAELDPDDPDVRAHLAWASFRAWRFDDAERAADACLELDPSSPEGLHVRGLVLERRGDLAGADRCFARAERLAPEWFPAPRRFREEAFSRQLEAARAALPEPFRAHLDEVTLIVEDVPAAELAEDDDDDEGLDPEQLLGLFVGAPLDQAGVLAGSGELPPRIYLFRRNLERFAPDPGELAEQIRVTLFHELGHYLGLEEDELDEAGYA